MPNMVIPNEGKLLWLQWMVKTEDADFGDTAVVLYSNDYTPIAASVYASFTHATFTGSSPVAIERGYYVDPSLTGDVAYIGLDDPPSWTCSGAGPQTCYGWLLYDVTTSTALAAQRFAAPRVMDVGATESLDPFKIGLQTLH